MNTESFWQYGANYWIRETGSSDEGLSQATAEAILDKRGIKTKSNFAFKKDILLFIGQFKSPLMMLLISAAVISAFIGETSDVIIILFIILSTCTLSFFQERNAGKVAEKLRSLITIKSTVLRDGQPRNIPSDQIVMGDVIILAAGDMLPADCIIIESNELYANEASLTGESYPVRKEAGAVNAQTSLPKRKNCLWQGTSIASGKAKAIVIQTDEKTLFGNIIKDASVTIETAFENGIKKFGYLLMKITLTLAVFILTANILSEKNVVESALFALALAVGMAPELLPAITTISMSAGAKRLLAKKVIVKKLNSIQNLGEINLLCTDKTGTITEGIVKVAGTLDAFGSDSELVKHLAVLNSSLESGYSNAIDEALKQLNNGKEITARKIGEVPYDFIRKRLSIGVQDGNEKLLITKGAFAQIINICSKIKLSGGNTVDISEYKRNLEKKFEEFGFNGLRAIGVCYKNIETDNISKDIESNMIFAGFIVMNDPIKTGIIETINELRQLKVGLKIITGDNINVAKSIAENIGIENPAIMTGEELFKTSSEALAQKVKNIHIFAEVEPQQKERIILALKRSFTVAYIGDGINDVSAINAADVGISVENAVDAAREAADFVLTEKDLTVLSDGIKEGRKTFANTLKYLYISTGSTFGNMCSMAAASLFLPFLPMLPKQILLTNFLTDIPFLAVASDNVDKEQTDEPRKWNIKTIRNYMLTFGFHSAVFDLITFSVLYFILGVRDSAFQTGWFIESVLTELLIVFIIRTRKNFFGSKPGKYLFILSLIAFAATLAIPYLPIAADIGLTPLPMLNLCIMLTIVIAYFITADILKVWFFGKYGREEV